MVLEMVQDFVANHIDNNLNKIEKQENNIMWGFLSNMPEKTKTKGGKLEASEIGKKWKAKKDQKPTISSPGNIPHVSIPFSVSSSPKL